MALKIGDVQYFRLKAHGTVLQCPQLVAEIGVDGAGINHPAGHGVQPRLIGQVIHAQLYLAALQQGSGQRGVAALGDPLVAAAAG